MKQNKSKQLRFFDHDEPKQSADEVVVLNERSFYRYFKDLGGR